MSFIICKYFNNFFFLNTHGRSCHAEGDQQAGDQHEFVHIFWGVSTFCALGMDRCISLQATLDCGSLSGLWPGFYIALESWPKSGGVGSDVASLF